MEELLKLMKALGKISIVIIMMSALIFIAIVFVTNEYAQAQEKNVSCDNSSYLLSNYTTNLTKTIGNSTFPLINQAKG